MPVSMAELHWPTALATPQTAGVAKNFCEPAVAQVHLLVELQCTTEYYATSQAADAAKYIVYGPQWPKYSAMASVQCANVYVTEQAAHNLPTQTPNQSSRISWLLITCPRPSHPPLRLSQVVLRHRAAQPRLPGRLRLPQPGPQPPQRRSPCSET